MCCIKITYIYNIRINKVNRINIEYLYIVYFLCAFPVIEYLYNIILCNIYCM